MKCEKCGDHLRPVVAIDIDGTLAQYHAALVDFIWQWAPMYHRRPHAWNGLGEFNDHIQMDKELYRQAKLAFRAGGFKRWMDPFPLAADFMQNLSLLPVDVWLTTTRPWMRMDNVDPDTREWLRRHNIPFKHLLFDEDKYGVLTELVDPERIILVLDDEWEQRNRCEDLGLPFVLRSTNWNHGVNARIVMDTYAEVLDLIKERIAIREALR